MHPAVAPTPSHQHIKNPLAFLLLPRALVKTWMIDHFLQQLPTPETVKKSWLYAWIGKGLLDSAYWTPSRHSLALGIALGWSIGLLPLYGLHIALVLLIGSRLRFHLPSAVLGTFITNPFTIPAVLILQYMAGKWLFRMNPFHSMVGSQDASLIVHYGLPFVVGGIMSAIVAGVAGYIGVYVLMGWKEKAMLNGVV